MRVIGDWQHMMSSAISVAPRTGLTGTGPTYGAPVTYRAHISRRRRTLQNIAGEEIVSGQAIYLNGSPAIETTAQVTLSTADVGSTEEYAVHPPIVAVERRFDESGPHHTVLFLGLVGFAN